MLSNTKKAIDDFFTSGWLESDIQYEGTKFDTPEPKRWISLQTIPYDRDVYAFDGQKGRKRTYYTQVIRCFAPNAQKAFDLAQLLLNFFECEAIGDIRVGLGQGDGNGAVDLENDCFSLTINFDIIDYE